MKAEYFLQERLLGKTLEGWKWTIIEYSFQSPSERDHEPFHVYFVCNPVENELMCW